MSSTIVHTLTRVTEDEVLARIRRLVGALDEAKKSIELTAKHVAAASAASDSAHRSTRVLDTSRRPSAKRSKARKKPAAKKTSIFRERIPPDALVRLHAISQVQNRSVAAVLNEALKTYEKTVKAGRRKS